MGECDVRISALFAAAAVAALSAAPLAANPLSRVLANSGLTPQDTNLMREAEQKLLAGANSGGASRAGWTNPDSGARGEVRIGGKQGSCLILQHQAHLKGHADPRQLNRKYCPSDSGWRLAP